MELKTKRKFMQTLSRPIQRNRTGFALIITMCFLIVALIVFGSVMYWISSNSKVTAMNNQFNMSEAAAEAATEKVLSQMNWDYISQSLSNSGTYYGQNFIPRTNDQATWPIQYVYSDTNGNANQISVNLGNMTTYTVPLNSQYAGLYGEVQPCTITATATPLGVPYAVPATVCESIQFASIPLFQFAIFYNMDLEIAAAQTLNIVGPVWSNGGLWSGSTTITFQSTVSSVGIATNTANDPFCSGYSGSGPSTYNLAPLQPNSGNDRITMPIGTNNDPAAVEAIVNLPPSNYALNTAAAYTTNGLIYFANGADLFLTNFSTGVSSAAPRGTNLVLYYQDANTSYGSYPKPTNWDNTGSYWTQMPYDFYIMTNRIGHSIFTNNIVSSSLSTNLNNVTNTLYAGYSFVQNVVFYDWREGWNGGSGISGKGKTVQAVQIDVGRFTAWLNGTNMPDMGGGTNMNGGQYCNTLCSLSTHKSHPIDSIYVYNSVPLTGTVLPAVRVTDGGMLPSSWGFTVATPMPIYVWGDYNYQNSSGSSLNQNSTTYTWPAGLMGDALTILSASWKDSVTSKKPAASSDTTVNAACLAGIVRSTNGAYSGGVENFFRTLESWGSTRPFYWNGSVVVMFPSQYATNSWQQTGNYYDAPARSWAFDTNFTQQAGLPPLTPQSKGVIRGSWSGY